MSITAVTGMYDVGRAAFDGRSMREYVDWLNKTLRVPLPFLVFLDPQFDASEVELKPEDRIVRVALSDYAMFGHKERIEEICASSPHVHPRDIAFKLPVYGMLVMSKLEMMKRAADETDAEGLLWMDAGLSRYLPDLTGAVPVIGAEELKDISIGIHATAHLAQFIRLGRLPRYVVGNCLAQIAAGDIYVRRDFASELSDRLQFMVETEWLPNDRWDNEQVATGLIYFRGGLPGARIIATSVGWANITRWLFGLPIHHRKMPAYVRWRMIRDEVRTRLASRADCYLPGSFPEQAYQDWVRARA